LDASVLETLKQSCRSHSFISEVTKEMIAYQKIDETEFNNVLFRLAIEFGKFIAINKVEESDVTHRTIFRFQQLKSFKLSYD
jgi:hypothetical protein